MKHGTTRKPQAKHKKPLQPCVTIEQIYAFEPGKPETYTPSPLMNSILEAMFEVCPLSSTTLGRYLDADPRKLTSAVFLLTGIEYAEMREKWGTYRIEKLRQAHPDWPLTRLVRAAGYSSPSSVWRISHRYKRKQEYRAKDARYHRSREDEIRDTINFYKNHPERIKLLQERDQDSYSRKVLKLLEEHNII